MTTTRQPLPTRERIRRLLVHPDAAAEHLTIREIARRVGIGTNTAFYHLRALGITPEERRQAYCSFCGIPMSHAHVGTPHDLHACRAPACYARYRRIVRRIALYGERPPRPVPPQKVRPRR